MTFILFTLRILFKCPFGFGLSFVNNLLHVWYIISIFFLSSFLLVNCLLGAGIPVNLWYPSPFLWVISLFIRKLVPFFFFFKFYGPDDQFLLLFTYGAVSFIGCLTCLLSPLAFYSLAHLWGSKNFL